ncbi:MAG: G1 family glutamic endopeptidase [Chloroflexota bacterium]
MIPELEQQPEDELNSIRERISPLTVDDIFNPHDASPAELTRNNLPLGPSAGLPPELEGFWNSMFTGAGLFRHGRNQEDFELVQTGPNNSQATGRLQFGSRREWSLNWSGAYVKPRGGLMITDVLGAWTVPDVRSPVGEDPAANFRSSMWIGLDGQRQYANSTLPQLGTAHHVNQPGAPGQTVTSWIQWWPHLPLKIKDFAVAPGDRMLAWLTVLDETRVRMLLKNDTENALAGWVMTAPTVKDAAYFPAPIQARVSGATAEWVLERPSVGDPPVFSQLANFSGTTFGAVAGVERTPAVFTECWYGMATEPGAPIVVRDTRCARSIGMYQLTGNPRRKVRLSAGSCVDRSPATGSLPECHEVHSKFVRDD